MSHSITVTRTTTTTTTSALLLNTGYMKTTPGILKFIQLVLGIVTTAIVAHYITTYNLHALKSELFHLLMTTTFMIGTFCLLLSCLISIATGSIISKTIYEVVYHAVGFICLLVAGIILMVNVNNRSSNSYYYKPYLSAAILSLINSLLYLFSTILATKTYRGI
ncbi:uncharacterized protein LOC123296949 [Chrysoperla carnea]|uniref:uncharacterized protein LOC123296949 n=1 Tax=Chrysoperla carnea TaxID=189513 RepID=UPI001D07F6B7|nr:uncharacterized protein LOC123296949 [Chrysoperla carnea]